MATFCSSICIIVEAFIVFIKKKFNLGPVFVTIVVVVVVIVIIVIAVCYLFLF